MIRQELVRTFTIGLLPIYVVAGLALLGDVRLVLTIGPVVTALASAAAARFDAGGVPSTSSAAPAVRRDPEERKRVLDIRFRFAALLRPSFDAETQAIMEQVARDTANDARENEKLTERERARAIRCADGRGVIEVALAKLWHLLAGILPGISK